MQLKTYFQNVRGLRGKSHRVRPLIESCDYEIIALVETWLQPCVHNNEVFPENKYMVYRRDRCLQTSGKRDGGDALLAVSHKVRWLRLKTFESPDLEDVWIYLDLEIPTYVCCIYISDRSVSAPYMSFFKSLFDNMAHIKDPDFKVIIYGDFNLASIQWSPNLDGSFSPAEYLLNDVNGINSVFVQTTSCFNLLQYNGTQNQLGRTLDLLLTDIDPEHLSCVAPSPILSEPIDAHHPPFQMDIDTSRPKIHPQCERKRYDFEKADFDVINKELGAINWKSELVGDLNEMVIIFNAILIQIIDRHVPLKHRRHHKYPVWFSHSLSRMMEEKTNITASTNALTTKKPTQNSNRYELR